VKSRIILADDHALVLEGLRRILESDYDLVATVQDGRALVAEAIRLTPDLVVCDISMPLLNGLEALHQCRAANLRAKFVFVTASPDVALATRAFQLGAHGYVLKHEATDQLLTAIREALLGRTYIAPRIAGPVMQNLMSSRAGARNAGTDLTSREREVLQLLAEGKSMKEAAAVLLVSPRTIEFHKNKIMEKTGLRTIAELTLYAARNGIAAGIE
jgi:DNA-binding NarL/FixJ family response regulator